MAEPTKVLDERGNESDAGRQDTRNEAELSDNELEDAAGGRIPCYPDSTSIPPPKDTYEPLSPSI